MRSRRILPYSMHLFSLSMVAMHAYAHCQCFILDSLLCVNMILDILKLIIVVMYIIISNY